MIKSTLRAAASAAVIALVATPALAQTVEDEIIVTATKRTTTLQDTPVAVTVTPAETIQRAQILDVLDLQSVVPSLRVDQLQASTQTNFIIRGFGNGANNPGIEPSVGVFVDGVYRSRSAAAIGNLPQLERVEVLAGPQSTLFGKNASAGVISIVTQAPQFETQGYVEAGLGNLDLFTGKAYLTGPLSDEVAYSIGGSFQKRDGYIDVFGSDETLNDRDRFDLRGQILWEPTDALSLRFIGDYSEIDELCCGTSTFVSSPVSGILQSLGGENVQGSPLDPFERVAYVDRIPENTLEDFGVSANVDYDFGNGLSLTSITAYRENSTFSDIDADFTLLDLLDTNERDDQIDTFTQELRITSNYDGAFNFQIGGFYFNETVDSRNTIGYGSDFRAYGDVLSQGALDLIEAANPDIPAGTFFNDDVIVEDFFTQDDETFSIFGTVDYEIGDRLTLTAGLNYTDVRKEVTGRAVNNDDFSNFDLTGQGAANAATLQGLLENFPNIAAACGLGPLAFNPTNIGAVSGVAACPGLGGVPGAAAFAGLQMNVAAGVGMIDFADPAQNPFAPLFGLQFLPQLLPFPNAVESGVLSDDDISYTFRANVELTDDLNVYASYATGYKSASFNLSRDSRPFIADAVALETAGLLPNNYTVATGRNFGTRFADPEESRVIELGAKARFDFGTINAAVFSQKLENFQTNAFVGAAFVLTNAGETRVNGIELSGRLFPTDNFTIDYAGTFLDPEFTDFTNAVGPGGTVVDRTGEKPANISDVSLSIGATYEASLGEGVTGFIRGDWQYEDGTLLDANLAPEGRAAAALLNPLETTVAAFEGYEFREQSIFNVSAGIEIDNGIGVQIWGRNITGDDYASTLFPGVAQIGIVNGYPSNVPTYGVNLRKEF